MDSFKKVQEDFLKVVELLDKQFSTEYAKRNPDMTKFLLDKIQQEKDRHWDRELNNKPI